jgi:hypothetical protein
MVKIDISESFRQPHRFLLPAVIVDSLEFGLLRDPIDDQSRVTEDMKVTDRPAGSKIE